MRHQAWYGEFCAQMRGRQIIGVLARMAPGTPIDEDNLSERLGLCPTFVAFVLDALNEAGLLRPNPLPPAGTMGVAA